MPVESNRPDRPPLLKYSLRPGSKGVSSNKGNESLMSAWYEALRDLLLVLMLGVSRVKSIVIAPGVGSGSRVGTGTRYRGSPSGSLRSNTLRWCGCSPSTTDQADTRSPLESQVPSGACTLRRASSKPTVSVVLSKVRPDKHRRSS